MGRKRSVRLSSKRKAEILLASAKENEARFGEYAVQPTKLSVENGVSQPVLGVFLADKLNPLLARKCQRTIGLLSRTYTQDGSGDDDLANFIDELADIVESDDSADDLVDAIVE